MKRRYFAYIIAAVALLIAAGLAACGSHVHEEDENECAEIAAEIKDMMRNWELFTFPYDSFPSNISFVTEQAFYGASAQSIRAYLRLEDEEGIVKVGTRGSNIRLVKLVENEWRIVPLTMPARPGGMGFCTGKYASFTITPDHLRNFDFIKGTYRMVTSVLYTHYSADTTFMTFIVDFDGDEHIVWAEFEITDHEIDITADRACIRFNECRAIASRVYLGGERFTFPYETFPPFISFVTEQETYSTSVRAITAYLSIADEERAQTLGWDQRLHFVKFDGEHWRHVARTGMWHFTDPFLIRHPGETASFTMRAQDLRDFNYFPIGTYRFVITVSYSPHSPDFVFHCGFAGCATIWAEFEITE